MSSKLNAGRVADRSAFRVGVFWTSYGSYGRVDEFATVEEAKAERNRLLGEGYKHVDIWKVTTEVVDQVDVTKQEEVGS